MESEPNTRKAMESTKRVRKNTAFTVRLPPELLHHFKGAVEHDGKTLSGAVRVMIREYVKASTFEPTPKETK